MIGLIDVDSKINNLALMKLSSYFKSMDEEVELVSLPTCRQKKIKHVGDIRIIAMKANKKYSKIFASVIFTRNQYIIDILKAECGDKIEFGGIGSYEPEKKLLPEIEAMKPDYDLYSVDEIATRMTGIGSKQHKIEKARQIVEASHIFTSRGCFRSCGFCRVPTCEGAFRQANSISSCLNEKSNILILHDNNITADPFCIDKLHEIRDRKLTVDINQGLDIRICSDDIAFELSKVKHLRSLHYAWDLMNFENQVLQGIGTLSKYIPTSHHMCFVLTGYNTTYEQDWYRCCKLIELGVEPYIMIFEENEMNDERLKHFARWINSRIYKTCSFREYEPWIKVQNRKYEQMQLEQC